MTTIQTQTFVKAPHMRFIVLNSPLSGGSQKYYLR
jgi:hypothetical protein